MERYHQWLADPAIDEETKQELRSIASEEKEIKERRDEPRNDTTRKEGVEGTLGIIRHCRGSPDDGFPLLVGVLSRHQEHGGLVRLQEGWRLQSRLMPGR